MGFLKELFEKKLKTHGKDFLEDDGLECGRTLSEYSLPKLRQPGDPACAQDEAEECTEHGGDHGLAVCYIRPQQSAKSFSYAQVRSKQVEKCEQQLQKQISLKPAISRIKYESVNQFSQKVELYRGSVATVFKAVCIATNTKMIMKAYYKQKMHPEHYHKLAREIQAMKVLNGPYSAELYASFEDAQCIYIIMEYCEGGDLFKTMLMHGGILDEQWVCVEVIMPLLRILEKMHMVKYLHRDIKPENIFLTAMGKFKLGDYGLAIKFDEELAFSRSGTLDYMAPEVLKNPSVPFQEGKNVDLATLTSRGVKPYGPPVDVWAAGVLAYELVCGRPPFEVEDEAQTAALIMYSDNIKFPPNRSQLWSEFVSAALVKNPDVRPTATQLLAHPWVQTNLKRTMSDHHRPSKELLLQPLPVDLPGGPGGSGCGGASKELKRTISVQTAGSRPREEAPREKERPSPLLAPLPTGAVPKNGAAMPTLPANFPGTPTGAARNKAHSFAPSSSSSSFSSGLSGNSTAERLSMLSLDGSKKAAAFSDPGQVPHSPPKVSQSSSLSPLAGGSPRSSLAPSTGSPRSNLMNRSSAGADGSSSGGTSPTSPPPARPAFKPLKVALPPETEFEVMSSTDGFCYSPTTPAPKPGIKERMKFYFQRQAGGAAGF